MVEEFIYFEHTNTDPVVLADLRSTHLHAD